MATELNGLLPNDLKSLIENSKILVVGSGGIGCELLKNLVLTGFKYIHIIDLDTIDVSNLNRQFLFRREHIGQPKSIIAKESALLFNPNVNIIAHHDSITEQKYDVNWYKQFTLVMNALDNRTARSHVNRMCLAADVPLIESGSAGYKGNVALHKKSISECYDCTPRPHTKTFPGCTIRNTPSEPIHCIIWAKHLFNQLFGLPDPDEDVSPDSNDPELINGSNNIDDGDVIKKPNISTRQWATNIQYDPTKLFNKLFYDDIKYLLSMDNLWVKRRAPIPISMENLCEEENGGGHDEGTGRVGLKEQRVWNIKECSIHFQRCILLLKHRLLKDVELIWDKDDDICMDFVTSCSNIRSFIFGIATKSKFDIKSMAGNIIPAIPSTNAIVAGLVVMTSFRVLRQQYHKCSTLYINNRLNVRKQLFVIDPIVAPNPKCYVCSEKPEIIIRMDIKKINIKIFVEKILKNELNMIAPDVELDDGKGTILISSEEGDMLGIEEKFLSEFNIRDGSRLKCDDFLQNYQLNIIINEMVVNDDSISGGKDNKRGGGGGGGRDELLYEIITDHKNILPKEEEEVNKSVDNQQPSTSTNQYKNIADVLVDDDDVVLIEEEDEDIKEISHSSNNKRNSSMFDTPTPTTPCKKRRINEQPDDDEQEEIVQLD